VFFQEDAMKQDHTNAYPLPESGGGWRVLADPSQIRSLGGVDPEKLALAWEANVRSGPGLAEQKTVNPHDERFVSSATCSSVLVVRHGAIVGEWYQNGDRTKLWNIWSCTKSVTGTAYGILFQESRERKLSAGQTIDLDSMAYQYIPQGYPLSDPRKARIRIRHLLSMTSGIKGEDMGVFGLPHAKGCGPFELALGRCPTENGISVAELWGEPGTKWDYSDPAFAHLALILSHLTGMETEEYVRRRIFQPLGIGSVHWDRVGGEGHIGPHSFVNGGLHITTRDFARFGYLALHRGNWQGRQLISESWMETAARASQVVNPNYGYTWWPNTRRVLWPDLPEDAFAALGYQANKCYIVPSLDLVVVRVGDGPWPWDDQSFLRLVMASLLP
jgi:CubicO group peptidase (beta-lactamase class C family)